MEQRGQATLPDLFYFSTLKGKEQVRKGGLPPLVATYLFRDGFARVFVFLFNENVPTKRQVGLLSERDQH